MSLAVWRDWIWRFVLHVATGLLAVGAHYGCMSLLVAARMPAVAASALGFVVGALVRFHTAYVHVYSPTQPARRAAPRFVAALALQFVANAACLAALLHLGVNLWTAQVATTAVLAFGTYIVYRVLVFV